MLRPRIIYYSFHQSYMYHAIAVNDMTNDKSIKNPGPDIKYSSHHVKPYMITEYGIGQTNLNIHHLLMPLLHEECVQQHLMFPMHKLMDSH